MPKRKPHTPTEQLSRAEWELMRICWKLGRASVRQILDESLKQRARDYRTVQTLLNRMAKKGYLEIEKEGQANYYSPAVSEELGLQEEIRRFLDEVIGPEPQNLELLRTVLEQRARRQ